MEFDDCAFSLLKSVIQTADLDEGFRDINWALLVGSVPRKAGMERKELLGINGKIFVGQGQAIQKNAAADVRVLVVGNPCNTNCLIAMNNAKEIPRDRWFAMTRLDENRARVQLAHKAGVGICFDGSYDVEKGLISSFPFRVRAGKWEIVQGLTINDFSRSKIDASVAELREEQSLVSELIS